MQTVFLLPEQTIRENGNGPAMDLGETRPNAMKFTLGITRIIEQESLDMGVHGSADGETWSDKPIASFPQKFYTGVSSITLELSELADIRFVRTQWKVSRWGRGDGQPLFDCYVAAEPTAAAAATAG
jgi:hypothetical protein